MKALTIVGLKHRNFEQTDIVIRPLYLYDYSGLSNVRGCVLWLRQFVPDFVDDTKDMLESLCVKIRKTSLRLKENRISGENTALPISKENPSRKKDR